VGTSDLVDGERSLRELLESTDSFPIDAAVAITLRAISAVHTAHGQYAPRYGMLSPAAVAIDFTGNVRVDWETDADDTFVVHDAKLDRRSDVLVLGLLLHCLVTTGRDEADLPSGLGTIVAKATSSTPMDRYQTAIAMHGALERFAQSISLRTGNAVIAAFMLKQLGMPDIAAPIRPPPISSGVPLPIADTARSVTARIPMPAPARTGRIAILPVIAPIETRTRPRTVQIPARGTAPNPVMPDSNEACDDGWDLPEAEPLAPAPRAVTSDVFELDESDLEIAELSPMA
jgi:hypothetical protein